MRDDNIGDIEYSVDIALHPQNRQTRIQSLYVGRVARHHGMVKTTRTQGNRRIDDVARTGHSAKLAGKFRAYCIEIVYSYVGKLQGTVQLNLPTAAASAPNLRQHSRRNNAQHVLPGRVVEVSPDER